MAFDASRPVPWRRLFGFFGIYAAVAVVGLTLLRGFDPGIISGLLLGGSVYLAVAVLLVKFGWNPPAFRSKAERRAAATAPRPTTAPAPDAPRARPAPTRRTSTGATNRPRRTRETRRR